MRRYERRNRTTAREDIDEGSEDLQGKIRNLPHFRGEALLPLFEAVINAFQAIEERGNVETGQISVQIVRHNQMNLNAAKEPPITGFVITNTDWISICRMSRSWARRTSSRRSRSLARLLVQLERS